MTSKYIKRIYTLNELGICLSDEDKETLKEFYKIIDLLLSCNVIKQESCNYFVKDKRMFVMYHKYSKEISYSSDICRKLSTQYVDMNEIMIFVFDSILNIETELCFKFKLRDSSELYYDFNLDLYVK